jgi:tetratricopeptide (TPR) repeat protein
VSADSPATPRKTQVPLRIWLFRALAAVLVPALFLVALECSLRLAGFGRTVRFMIPDDKPGYLRTNPDFVSSFMPGSFDLRPLNFRMAARKPPNTLRVVVLGESAAQGIPVPSFGFAPQLRAQLRARYPGKEIEVINTGIVAINSHVVYQIAGEMAGYSPDLFVVYMGNNEVVGPYGPGCSYLSEMPPLWVIRLSEYVKSTRTGQLAARLIGRLSPGAKAPAEWGGMAMFVNSAVAGDDPRLEAVYGNFRENLRGIVGAARSVGAQTILCTVASNLRACPPFLSLHSSGLSKDQLAAWQRSHDRGRIMWLLGNYPQSRDDLVEALRLDPHYADTAFMLGIAELGAGDTAAARAHLVDAEHWDALRFRPDPRINAIVREVSRESEYDVTLVDAALAMGSDPGSTGEPAGRGLFFEHVHLDWAGNYALARSIAETTDAIYRLSGRNPSPWLDSQGCASALAYSPHERLTVLQKIATIVQNPPFTNQILYSEDCARLERDLGSAGADAADPEKLRLSDEMVKAAVAADSSNPDLAKMAEGIDDDLGDLAGALAQARRAEELEPWNYALFADEAIKLSRLGRFDEAEQLLNKTAAKCSPRDLAAMAPAFADFYTRTKRLQDGIRYMDGAILRTPADNSIRIIRARLYRLSGDSNAAEREYRGVLALDPSSQPALEALVNLLGESGRTEDAEVASLSALGRQPTNLANNLRSAIIHDTSHDDALSAECLLAAEKSGPVTAAVELRLAQQLYRLGRLDDTLSHLALARRITVYEGGGPREISTISRSINNVWSQLH